MIFDPQNLGKKATSTYHHHLQRHVGCMSSEMAGSLGTFHKPGTTGEDRFENQFVGVFFGAFNVPLPSYAECR